MASLATIDVMVGRQNRRSSFWFGLLASATIVLAGCGEDGSEPASPTAIDENETGSSAPTTTAPALEWSRVAAGDEDLDVEAEIVDLAAGGPGFVAVGSAGERAAVWTSADGVDWTRVPDLPDPDPEGLSGLSAVAAGGPGVVAVSAPGPFGVSEVVVLGSPDGLQWTELAGGDVVPRDGEVLAVTAAGPGLVAVGSDTSRDAAVWLSPDGRSWTRVAHDEATFGDAQMTAVVAGGPGLVAVGDDVWTSPDGLSWTRSVVEGQISAVTVGGPGFVAVGQGDDARGAIWTSTEGTTWTPVPGDQAISTRPGEGFADVVSAGQRLVAIGDQTTVWTSTDGLSWTQIPDGPESFGSVSAAAADGPNVVVVGSLHERPAVWEITATG